MLVSDFNKVVIFLPKLSKASFNLLKSKFLLDNYVVHHSNEEENENEEYTGPVMSGM